MVGEVIWFCFYLGIIEKGNGLIKSTMFLKMICVFMTCNLGIGKMWENCAVHLCFISFLPV